MTPARRKKVLRLKNGGKKRRLFRLLLVAGLVLALAAFLGLNTRIWRPEAKVSFVVNSPNGEIVVVSLDADHKELTNIVIPATTELEVSRGLGRWKAKSIWQLGQNEKAGGALLRETVVKNFHFPVLGWADRGALGFAEGDALGIIKAIVLPYKSDLTLADKIRIGFFSLGVAPGERNQLNLAGGRFLKKTRLKDGEDGYLVVGKIPKELLLVFSQPQIAERELKVNIKDATTSPAVAAEVGETIEVLGAKVAAVTRLPVSAEDCLVEGKETDFEKILADVYGCKIGRKSSTGNFDIEIEIGESFVERF